RRRLGQLLHGAQADDGSTPAVVRLQTADGICTIVDDRVPFSSRTFARRRIVKCPTYRLKICKDLPHPTPADCIRHAHAWLRRLREELRQMWFLARQWETFCKQSMNESSDLWKNHNEIQAALEAAMGPELLKVMNSLNPNRSQGSGTGIRTGRPG